MKGNMENSEKIFVKINQIFSILLDSNHTTGYKWIPYFNKEMINLIDEKYHVNSERTGSSGIDEFRFKAIGRGSDTLTFLKKRSWQQDFVEQKAYSIIID